ncbi:MAG: hypothetical protein WCB85_08240 [Candidatus Dormiibacterota bacterium]
MMFGRRRSPGRLLAARSVVYFQAGLLVISAGVEVLFAVSSAGVIGGGVVLDGLFAHASIEGGGLIALALLQATLAVVIVYLAREAEGNPDAFRSTMTAAQAGYAVYLVGFSSVSPGAWITGPLLSGIVLTLHWWPEIGSRLQGSPAAAEGVGSEPGPARSEALTASVAGEPSSLSGGSPS